MLTAATAGVVAAHYNETITQTWGDLIGWSKSWSDKEGDGTRVLDYDEIRKKFKDRLTEGELQQLIKQVQKFRGERNIRKRGSRNRNGGGFPSGTGRAHEHFP
jgi:hypothetical protein